MFARGMLLEVRCLMMSDWIFVVSLVVLCRPEFVYRALFVSGVMMT